MAALVAGQCALKLLNVMSKVVYLLKLNVSLLLRLTSVTLPRLQSVSYHFLYHGSYHGISRRMQTFYTSVSKPPGHGPVPGPVINYTGPREVLLEFVILVF